MNFGGVCDNGGADLLTKYFEIRKECVMLECNRMELLFSNVSVFDINL